MKKPRPESEKTPSQMQSGTVAIEAYIFDSWLRRWKMYAFSISWDGMLGLTNSNTRDRIRHKFENI